MSAQPQERPIRKVRHGWSRISWFRSSPGATDGRKDRSSAPQSRSRGARVLCRLLGLANAAHGSGARWSARPDSAENGSAREPGGRARDSVPLRCALSGHSEGEWTWSGLPGRQHLPGCRPHQALLPAADLSSMQGDRPRRTGRQHKHGRAGDRYSGKATSAELATCGARGGSA